MLDRWLLLEVVGVVLKFVCIAGVLWSCIGG